MIRYLGVFFCFSGSFDAPFSLTKRVFFFRVCSQDAGLPVVSAKFMKWHLRRSFLKLAIKEGVDGQEGKHWMIWCRFFGFL